MDSHGNGMGMMTMTPPPPSSSSSSPSSASSSSSSSKMMMMMHMSFYWGSDAQVLFTGWPGNRSPGMYIASLAVVFLLAFLLECLSRSTLIDTRVRNRVVSGLLRTLLHAVRMGVAYLVMLAVMSFNVGVFMAAVAGHALGFFVTGSRVFGSGGPGLEGYSKHSDVGPISC
ncbi:hypothetical protein vseg_010098 [Gypsophila vaccaria]